MGEINTCPFCSGAPTLAAKSPVEGPTPWRVSCPKCWAAGPASTTEAEAISSWNRRAAVAELVEAGKFLLDRLVDHEVRMTSDADAREWNGHVTPAMARFRSLLSRHQAGPGKGGGG